MRRSLVLLLIVAALLAMAAIPAAANHHQVTVNPGQSVEVIDGIYIYVEPNGDVRVIDGIYIQKISTGGQPTEIRLDNGHMILNVIPGGCLDPKLCL